MRNWLIHLAMLLGTVLSLALLWGTDWPLGVAGDASTPEEWTWKRIPTRDDAIEVAFGCALGGIAAAAYALFAWLGAARLPLSSTAGTIGWLVGLVIAGFSWLWIVQETPIQGYGLSKAPQVLYYPGYEGYYFIARYERMDVPTFLSTYEARMAAGDVLHIGTHPPGLILLHRGLIALCRNVPGIAELVEATEPDSVSESLDDLEHQTRHDWTPLTRDRAPLWLAALLTQAAAALAVVPLYLLVRRNYGRRTAWRCAALWPLVPAVAVFLPKSDALFPLIGLALLWLWLEGIGRRSGLLCFCAGVVLWLGLMLSLALLPVVAVAGCLTAWEFAGFKGGHERRQWAWGVGKGVGWCAAAVAVPVLLLWLAYDLNLVKVWIWNYRNHAAFYHEYARTYWKWLLVNPVEYALAVGAPVLCLAAASCFHAFRNRGRRSWPSLGSYVCCPVVLAVLWLSGKNMGEAARLWLVVQPWAVWLAANVLDEPDAQEQAGSESSGGLWMAGLALQAVVCIGTVMKVYGFTPP